MKWQDPPAGKVRRAPDPGPGAPVKYRKEAAELRANPGVWALVFEGAYSSSPAHVRTGFLRAFRPAGAFEARGRRLPDGRYDVYVRFVGKTQPKGTK